MPTWPMASLAFSARSLELKRLQAHLHVEILVLVLSVGGSVFGGLPRATTHRAPHRAGLPICKWNDYLPICPSLSEDGMLRAPPGAPFTCWIAVRADRVDSGVWREPGSRTRPAPHSRVTTAPMGRTRKVGLAPGLFGGVRL